MICDQCRREIGQDEALRRMQAQQQCSLTQGLFGGVSSALDGIRLQSLVANVFNTPPFVEQLWGRASYATSPKPSKKKPRDYSEHLTRKEEKIPDIADREART